MVGNNLLLAAVEDDAVERDEAATLDFDEACKMIGDLLAFLFTTFVFAAVDEDVPSDALLD